MRDVGRYRILGRIASGGMAEVYRAEALGAEGVRKEVALKVVRADHLGSPGMVARFVREARLAVRLSHANVVQVFEFGEADGRHFLAMELVRGHSLARVAERARELGLRFGAARAVFVAAEVADGLAYAHQPGPAGEPGLVHRDVSPQNILVSWEGEVKLADFGIARAERGGLTAPGTLEGKLAWVAPEQARGEAVDGRADLFSLGVVLWELLTGARLFARDSEAATLEALLRGPPPSPPSAWNEAIPGDLDALVLRCLERDPARRPPGARAVAEELRAILARLAPAPREWELRTFMRRLWPEGDAGDPPPAPPTVRRTPLAAEPQAPVAAERETEATRVLGAGRRAADGTPAVALFLAALAAAGVAVGAMGWRFAGDAAASPAATEGPAAGRHAEAGEARSRGEGGGARSPAEGAEAGAGAFFAGKGPSTAHATAPAAPPRAPGAPGTGAPGPGTEGGTDRAPGSPLTSAPAARLAAESAAPLAVEPPPSVPILGARLPAATTGEGVLSVNVSPWGSLEVDGRPVGDTPREVRLAAGPHRVRVVHPRLGSAEATVRIVAGRRTGWYPRLVR